MKKDTAQKEQSKDPNTWLVAQKLFAIGALLKGLKEDWTCEDEQFSATYGLGEIITELSVELHSFSHPGQILKK